MKKDKQRIKEWTWVVLFFGSIYLGPYIVLELAELSGHPNARII